MKKSLKNSLRFFDEESTDPITKAKQEMNDLLDEDLQNIKTKYLAVLEKKRNANKSKTA